MSTLLAGCASEDDTPASDEITASEQATSTTRVPRAVDQSDRPQVSFDPCLDIPDETLTEAGFDPATEEMNEFSADTYTFLNCSYNTTPRGYGLNLMSGNVTFAEEQQKVQDYSESTEVEGRRALRKILPGGEPRCAISMETGYGIFIVSRLIQPTRSDYIRPREQWCDGMEELAGLFARHLPAGA